MKKFSEQLGRFYPGFKKLLLIMRLSILLILMAVFSSTASVYSQVTKLTLKMDNARIADVFDAIENQSEFFFFYNRDYFNDNLIVSVDVKEKKIEEVLESLFKGQEVNYEIFDRNILIKVPAIFPGISRDEQQQQQTISGRVTDSGGQPLPGVTVVVKGTTQGTVTNTDGNYTLSNIPGDATLVFSFVGMKTQEIAVANKTTISVTMAVDAIGIEEVVAIGYGSQSRRTISSAISKVSIEEIESINAASFDNMFQGKISGVHVVQGSGMPGSNMTVRIRGITSLNAGNDPLYVIDGIPINSSGRDGIADGANPTSPIADINPQDIKSIEVLKDAASTSIYGARAANGVILVTTKKGTIGQASLDVNYSLTQSQIYRELPQINARQYRDLMHEAYASVNRWPYYIHEADSLADACNGDVDWQSLIFRSATTHNVNVSANGGQERFQYYLSGSYLDAEGILKNTSYSRITTLSNIIYNLSNNLTVGNNFSFSNTLSNRMSERSSSARGIILRTMTRLPTLAVWDRSGKLLPDTPLANLTKSFQRANSNRIISNLYGEWVPISDLKFKSSFGIDVNAYKEDSFFPSEIYTYGNYRRRGDTRYNQVFIWINENTLTYSFSQNDHNLSGLIGNSVQKNETQVIRGTTTKAASDYIITLNAGANKDEIYTTETSHGLVSFFTRLNYDYVSKYLLTATVRYDGSSRFGENNKFGFFPSGSAGWIVSEEKFLNNVPWISNLKLRASFGYTGNQDIGNYIAQGLYITGLDYNGEGGIAPASNGIANPDLSWEKTGQLNTGLDFSFFKNRVKIIGDYYIKTTNNLLFTTPLPVESGYSSAIVNLGSIENKGWELNFDVMILDKTLKWNTNFNIAHNENRVLSLPDGKDIISSSHIIREGEPLATFWGHKALGVFPTDEDNINQLRINSKTGPILQGGDMEFLDINGDNVINNDDKVITGNANPEFVGGFTNTFSYKGFKLSMFFNFATGFQILNYVKKSRNSFALGTGSGASTDILRRWQEPGDITDIPRIIYADKMKNFRSTSSMWIEDGDFLRCKDITLSYDFSKEILQKYRISRLRLYTSMQNALMFTNYSGFDPEAIDTEGVNFGRDYGNYPLPFSWNLGINVGF